MTTSSPPLAAALAAMVALISVPASALTAASASASAVGHGPVVRSSGSLADLQPGTAGPFDGARASFQLVASAHGSHALLRVSGIGAAADGSVFGAHLHLGPCVAGNGAAALGHYNTDVLAGITPARVDERREVWLDLRVEDGAAASTAAVPFVPLPGARSVVVHAKATDHHTGGAGDRLACLPVVW
jgi:Cu-Zn family superoxide dismutase